MQFFEDTLKEKISSFWESFRAEIILISVSLVIVLVSLAIFIKANNEENKSQFVFEEEPNVETSRRDVSTNKIYIDLSGAVEKPDVYEVTSGARLKDVLILGSGLSAEADRQFFARNFNLARILTDQEKMYIPSVQEIVQGLFGENPTVVDQIQPRINNVETTRRVVSTDKIDINIASVEQLDTLPGVGQITAQKIISNRPYNSVEELSTKKVVNKGVYEKIKDLVVIN